MRCSDIHRKVGLAIDKRDRSFLGGNGIQRQLFPAVHGFAVVSHLSSSLSIFSDVAVALVVRSEIVRRKHSL